MFEVLIQNRVIKFIKRYAIPISIAGIVILFGGVMLFSNGRDKTKSLEEPAARPVKTIVLENQNGVIKRTYAGEIDANLNSELSFRVSGPLVRLLVQPGQSVRKGELLAEIDPRDYKFNVEKLQSELDKLNTQLKIMKIGAREEEITVCRSRLSLAEARENLAKSELDRIAYGLENNVATQSEYDQAKCAYETTKAETVIARKNLHIAEVGSRKEDIEAMLANIQSVKVQLKMAQAALEDTRLTAPFDGVVGKKYVEENDQVKAGQPIIVLQDNSRTEVVIHIPQNEIETTSTKRKMAVRFTQAGAELSKLSFPLTFKEIDTVADQATKTYRVTLVMVTPKDVPIYPGMTVEVDVESRYNGMPSGFLVPASAIVGRADGQPIVWRINPKTSTAEAVPVTPGQIIGDEIQITGKLKAGDRIIIAGASFIYNGQKVSASAYRYDEDVRARMRRLHHNSSILPAGTKNITFSSYTPAVTPFARSDNPQSSDIPQ